MSNYNGGILYLLFFMAGTEFAPEWVNWIILLGFTFVGCMFLTRKILNKKNSGKK